MSGDILDRKKVFSGFKISNSCVGAARNVSPDLSQKTMTCPRGRGGVLPHKGLMSQGMFFGIFVLNRVSFLGR